MSTSSRQRQRLAKLLQSCLWVISLIGLATITGCNRNNVQTESNAPGRAPRVVTATPADVQNVYVDQRSYAEPTTENPELVGYETLNNGEQVQVVTYVHTYPEPIETYPRVWWSGNWYYNINGNFVYYSPFYDAWCSYWGPPLPLVYAWNFYYPWAPYTWGVGFYGPGWYWGGVGVYGYHAYGRPPAHYHHHYYGDAGTSGRPRNNARPASPGAPSGDRPTTPATPKGQNSGIVPPNRERTSPVANAPSRPQGPANRAGRSETKASPTPSGIGRTRVIDSNKKLERIGRMDSPAGPSTRFRQPTPANPPGRTATPRRITAEPIPSPPQRTSRSYAVPGYSRSGRAAVPPPSPNRARATYQPSSSATYSRTQRQPSPSSSSRSYRATPPSSRISPSRGSYSRPSSGSYRSSPPRSSPRSSAPRSSSSPRSSSPGRSAPSRSSAPPSSRSSGGSSRGGRSR